MLFALRAISPRYRIPWLNGGAQAEKITLSGSPVGVFRPLWVAPTNSLLEGTILMTVPQPGSGTATGFPFARRVCVLYVCYMLYNNKLYTIVYVGFLLGLRID
jgi:hypothetical protein